MSRVLLTAMAVAVFVPRLVSGDVAGVWDLTLKATWTTIPSLTCTLAQKGQELTGSCKAAGDPDDREAKLVESKIDGEQIQLGWRISTPDGENWTYTLRGTVDAKAGTMKGDFKLSGRAGGGDGSFSGKKRAS